MVPCAPGSWIVVFLPGRRLPGNVPLNSVLGGCSSSRPASPALSAQMTTVASAPWAMRARRLARSARASRSAASVRFTPARTPSLSPRRAPLWPALPPPTRQRRPAPCCMGPPPGAPSRAHRNAAHHSAGAAGANRVDRRPRQGPRHPTALTRRRSARVAWCSDADGATCSASGAIRFVEKLGLTPVVLDESPNKGRSIIEKFYNAAADQCMGRLHGLDSKIDEHARA